MKVNKDIIEVVVRHFFYSFFSEIAGRGVTDISEAQPITVKQLFVAHIDDVSKHFNRFIPRVFARINDINVPERLSEPKTFAGATALIKYTLGGDAMLYDFMVERYKYHFTQALSGSVEKSDSIRDTTVLKAAGIIK